MNGSDPTKEKLAGPQLAVQEYLNYLLQEATVSGFDRDSTSSDAPDLSVEPVSAEPAAAEKNTTELPHDATTNTVTVTTATIAATEDDVSAVADSTTPTNTTDLSIGGMSTEHENAESPIRATPVASTPIESNPIATPDQVNKPATSDADPSTDTNTSADTNTIMAKKDLDVWSKSRFECLIFKVGELKIAVPLIELGGIYQANKGDLTSIFGQPDWFMGVANVHTKRIRAVNTASWLMPDHYKADLKEEFKFVIQLDRSDWGLACEVVADSITLEPTSVKWRSDRSKRPWLAGTVIQYMCAIIDVQGFISLLNDPVNGFKAHLK